MPPSFRICPSTSTTRSLGHLSWMLGRYLLIAFATAWPTNSGRTAESLRKTNDIKIESPGSLCQVRSKRPMPADW